MNSLNTNSNTAPGTSIFRAVMTAFVFTLPVALQAETTGVMNIYVDTVLTEDHVGSIKMLANDITLDCDGHSVISTGPRQGIGVSVNSLSAATGVTIKNCRAIGFSRGFYAILTENVSFLNNIAIDNFTGFDIGISTPWARLVGNRASGNDNGISCYGSHCLMQNNVAESNLNYGLNLGEGNSVALDNLITDSSWGIRVPNSSNNSITGNTITGTQTAIRVFSGSSFNLVHGNTIIGNGESISILSDLSAPASVGNMVSNNNLTANREGIHARGNVKFNEITGNLITLSRSRGLLFATAATDNLASNNTLELNCIGVRIETDASDNQVFNNNFINNGTQAEVLASAGPNAFSAGTPESGNYWNDFDEPVEGCLDDLPADGICDSSYIFTGGLDAYPLTEKDGWQGSGGGRVVHDLPVDPCTAKDFDFDGVLDAQDNCPFDANPDQADSDGDRQGDVCDGDDDNDGVGDFNDNCPLNPNPDQQDTDGDGIGDACTFDADGDGVANEHDTCPATPLDQIVNEEGCSGAQTIGLLCDVNAFDNHGRYVSCVAHAAQEAVRQGLITPQEKSGFVSLAAHAKP